MTGQFGTYREVFLSEILPNVNNNVTCLLADTYTAINEIDGRNQHESVYSISSFKCLLTDTYTEIMDKINTNLKTEEVVPFYNGYQKSEPYNRKKMRYSNGLLKRIHILSWIRDYNKSKALADMIAGITIGLTIIPQSIAYASLAGLSPEYGLYSAFVGSFVYVIFGTIPQVSIGPTSLMALLTLQYTSDLPVDFVVILAFLAGVVELTMGVFNLGFVVNLISHTVTSAFTTGTSIIVLFVQLKTLVGIKSQGASTEINNLLDQITTGDSLLGFVCIGLLLSLRKLGSIKYRSKGDLILLVKKILWYVSISRNAIVVVGSSLMAYQILHYNINETVPFALSTKVNSTTLLVQQPAFVINHLNNTYNIISICKKLGSGILVVPIVAVLANVAIAKAFVKDTTLDASQEMFTLGVCNIVGSFFSAMPTCGAFTRSAVSQASGVKTPLSGIYSGALVLLAIGVLTPYFEYIPRSALSAVLITAVLHMADFKIVKELWIISKKDTFNWVVVFIVCLIGGVELGLLFGIITDILFILIRLTKPKIRASKKMVNGITFIHIEPHSDIYYAGGDSLRTKINSVCSDSNYQFPIVINCCNLKQCNYTLMQILRNILTDLEERNIQIFLHSLPDSKKEHFSNMKNVYLIDNINA